MSYLACTAGVLNEGRYLKQWLDYNLIQGFEHFYIYDNGSTDNTFEVLQPYIDQNIVTLRFFKDYKPILGKTVGMSVVDYVIEEFKLKHFWMMGHSIDEYIYCKDGTRVADFLKDYEKYSGLVLPWRLFNSSGLEKYDDRLIIDRFHTYTNDPDQHIKTIYQPCKTKCCVGNPHSYYYKEGFAVFEDGVRQQYGLHAGAQQKNHYPMNKILTNHYFMMSKEEWEIKNNKGRNDIPGLENVRRSNADRDWEYYNSPDRTYYECHALDKYIDMLHLM